MFKKFERSVQKHSIKRSKVRTIHILKIRGMEVKFNHKKVITWFAIFLLTFTLASYFMFPIKAPGSLTVTPEADRVTIENPLVQIVISAQGVRPIKWTTAEGLELAADARPSGAMGNRTPIWDWLPRQEWPGELCLGNYSYKIVESNDTVATIRFNYTCSQSPIAGLQVVKVLTFYVDKYYFDMKVVLINPTNTSISTAAEWDPGVGYRFATVEYAEPLTELYQAYQEEETAHLDLCLGWNKYQCSNLRWVAVYSRATGEIVAAAIYNATNSVWLEGAGGVWGSETCVEFLSLTIEPESQVAYILKVYGGPLDFTQLSEIGILNLARGLAYRAFPFTWGGETYCATTYSNSTVTAFNFSQPLKQVSFNVTGPLGTSGFCNVTIPKTLLKGNATHPWKVFVDDTETAYIELENETHTFIYFTYNHTIHKVQVIGTWVVPEFPAPLVLPLLMIVASFAGFLRKRFCD